jgi:ubiquitin-conjugating enzyme E2 variant
MVLFLPRHLAKSMQVDLSTLPTLATWKRDYTMETILLELRRFVLLSIAYR